MNLKRIIIGIMLIAGMLVATRTSVAATKEVSDYTWLEMCYVMARNYGVAMSEVEHISRNSLTVEPIVLAKGITTYKAIGEGAPFASSRRTCCIIRVQDSNEKAIIADIGPADSVTPDRAHSHDGYYDLVIVRTGAGLTHPQTLRMTYQGDHGGWMTGIYRFSK
jgi:hypothetical protein